MDALHAAGEATEPVVVVTPATPVKKTAPEIGANIAHLSKGIQDAKSDPG